MSDRTLYCRGPASGGSTCEREVSGHGEDLCETHMKQWQRNGKLTPIAEKVSAKEHLLNLVDRWAQADGDDEYDAAERAVVSYAKSMGKNAITAEEINDLLKKALSTAARKRLADSRARGVRIGRPPIIDPKEAARLFELGKLELIGKMLKVHARTVRRALTKAGVLSKRPPAPCPRPARESP